MKDTVIKGTGTSRKLKAPATMPETFDEWRSQLLAGTATVDISLNPAGCDVVGTALTKETLLKDATKTALELSQSDPTVDDALYALSQKGSPAEVHVIADNGTQVTMTKGGKTLTAMVSGGEAVLYPTELGEWTIKYTFDSSQKTKQWKLEVIGIVYVYPFTIGDNLNDTDWADIDICGRLGMAQQFFKVGDSKTVNIGGTNYEVQIIGFNHDDKVSGGKAAYSFQLVDCLNQTQQMNTSNTNTGGWNGSAMRGRMSTYKSQLPAALRNVIKTVKKKSGTGGGSSSGTQQTNDDLFLLSEIEIFGTTTYSVAGEGTQYEWYKAGNSRIKKVNGSANFWWERSPYSGYTDYFCFVNGSGNARNGGASNSYGVSFGFCV
ncbi:MAG: DUF6273 domain-containing protein [Oscillospiraceae bacterium]